VGKRRPEEEWQKPYVECVLSHHSACYGTNLVLTGWYESVYGCLRAGKKWDWVCRDSLTDAEGAVEVKELTRKDLQERHSILWEEIGEPLENSLSGKLPGTFVLDIRMTEERPALGDTTKRKLIAHLEEEIKSIAPALKLGESYDLASQFEPKLKPALAVSVTKHHDSGSKLHRGMTFAHWGELLKGNELLGVLNGLFQQANSQLAEAKSRGIQQTFFIIVQRLLGESEVDEVQNVLCQLPPHGFSDIEFCYWVVPSYPYIVRELTLPSGTK